MKNNSLNKINNAKIIQIIILGSLGLFVILGSISYVFAEENVQYNLIQPLPGIKETTGFPAYVEKLIPFILAFVALAAFVQIVFGGIMYATSGGNPSAISDATNRIWMAILGLLLALSGYLILRTINPDLVNLQFEVFKVQVAAPPNQEEIEEKAKENKCKNKCKPEEQCQIQQNGNVICIPTAVLQ